MGKKKLCKFHKRRKAEETECRLMDSWLCWFYEDVFCPFSKIPKEKRLGSVCVNCEYQLRSDREMAEEEEEEDESMAELIEEIERTGVWE
jgi:hypothetical protein